MRLIARSVFDIGKRIGEGKNGKVYVLRLRTKSDDENVQSPRNYLMAGKSYSYKYVDDSRPQLMRELEIHSSLDHPSIVKLHACFFDALHARLFLVLDLGFSDFFYFLTDVGPLSEALAAGCLAHVLEALAYIHDQEVIFSDLKPENLIVFAASDEHIQLKLTDFGASQRVPLSTALCGTVEYQAPEQKREIPYTNKIDIYAAGILLYEMLTLTTPSQTPSPQVCLFSEDCTNLWTQLTAENPDNRPTALESLRHCFFVS